eukprot:4296886-Pyramimonas_sp.AAC.1
MLSKPSTGHMLIVRYSSMYRIWQRLRRPMLGALLEEVERGYWGASRGRSSVDCARSQAVREEADAASNRFSVLPSADYSKYYDTIPLLGLRDKFLDFKVPTAFLKLVFNVWRAPR